ncbi:MAG: HlyD family efflux transporter periplasmic adaptor subunit [Chloroflexi bacterium]|nr:HlyD family efflux transporter periplasmic adaptor subunit [Chloroflexota bacterium]
MRYLAVVIVALAMLMAAGCGGTETITPEPEQEPTVQAAQAGESVVSATGEVIPADYTVLSFVNGGTVAELLVDEGDQVSPGDVIARLDTTQLEAELAAALAGLAQAEADLARTEEGPTEDEIAAAENTVRAANARTAAAAANRDALFTAITEADIMEAEAQLHEASLQLEELQESMDSLIHTANTIDLSEFEPGDPNPLSAGEGLALQIELAELQLTAASATLEDLLDGPDPDRVAVANARIALAAAQADAAEARLDLLMAQPFPEEIAVAEAGVEQAEANVEAVEARIAQSEIQVPFGGTVVNLFVDEAEYIGPGQPVLEIGDLEGLRVETTDLNEIDVARVDVGDEVIVTFDALPGVEVDGEVSRIAPKNSPGTGVNYTVVIELIDTPDAVRWGMTAFVDIIVDE